MIRHFAAIALVLCVTQVPLYAQAQDAHFTVTNTTASVHKSPSTGAPVIGKAASGEVFTVTRELGSWVKISWPAAEDGVGYLHVSWGRLSHGPLPFSNQTISTGTPRATQVASRTAPAARPVTSSTSTTPGANTNANAQAQANRAAASQVQQQINSTALASTRPTEHLLGIGGRMGSTMGYGISGRASITDHLGVQLEVSRYAPSSIIAPERMTSVQFAPSVMYSLPDKLTDYIWIRPYVGGGLTMYRHTLNSGIAGDLALTDNGIGQQLFGGTALAFASAPRFTLSFDYGYRWADAPLAPFAGTELAGKGLSISGHWYVK